MESIKSVRETVKARDGISDAEFDELLEIFKEDLEDWRDNPDDTDPEELLADHFGLEPDYLFDPELGMFG